MEGSEKTEDIIGFLTFVLGFGIFAGLSAIPAMQV